MEKSYIHYTTEDGQKWKKVAENESTFFLVPIREIEGGIEYDYTNIKAFSKEEPDYPLERVEDFSGK